MSAMSDSVWVLTEEYNDYDQYGEYFVKVFKEKPTADVLKSYLNGYNVEHVLSGGGRRYPEDQWYWLRERELG